MSDNKKWGSTVMGWFVVKDQTEGSDEPESSDTADAADPTSQPAPPVFNTPPPPAPGGKVDFDQVFEAAGIDGDERQRVSRTLELLTSLPPGTEDAVKKQIVMASLRAFGVPIEKIIEAGAQELQALDGYIRAGAADTEKVTAEADLRIKQYEEEIVKLKNGDAGARLRTAERRPLLQREEARGAESPRVLRAGSGSARRSRIAEAARTGKELRGTMGLFSRLGNLWKGFLSLWISDIEKEHPEIAYENAINSMIGKYAKLKGATAAIIRRREDLDERFKKANADLAQTEAELNTAVETNQDDLAVVLIQKKNQLNADIAEMKTDLETAHSDAQSAKTSLLGVQTEIKKLQAERETMLAKMQSAQARIKIQEQLDGLSVDDEVRALDNVRTHIKNTIAEANLGKELSDSSLDSRLAGLRSQVGDVQAKQELAAIKARKAAQQQGQKTM